MSVMKSLWASIQGDPVFMRKVNGWLTIFWVVMIPVSIATGWITSVTYVAALSLWALVSGHWSAWQAARVEVLQAEEAEKREREDVSKDVVERMIDETEVNASPGGAATACGPDDGNPAHARHQCPCGHGRLVGRPALATGRPGRRSDHRGGG
jgi:hypothetical protein